MSALQLTIWDADGARRLESSRGCPRVDWPRGARAAPHAITDRVGAELGLDVAFVRVAGPAHVELECLSADAIPRGLAWRPHPMLPRPHERAPWQRPRWLATTLAAADAALADAGLTRRAPAIQVRHTSITGMLAIPTGRHPVWLKAVPPLFAHEAAVVRWLAAAAGRTVPTVVADGPGWWISAPYPEPASAPAGDCLVAAARLQLESAGRVDELLALGCPARPLEDLPSQLAAVADSAGLVADPDRARLEAALPRLAALCEEVTTLDFPATLVHGDMTARNVRWTSAGWFIYDWTDACVSHPFVELATLACAPPARARERARAFASVWSEAMPASSVARALAAVPAIGAAHQVATYGTILREVDCSGCDAAGGRQMTRLLRVWVRQMLDSLVVAEIRCSSPYAFAVP